MKTINKYIAIAATLFGMSSCSDFLEEYSQDLSRVQNIDDLQELVMGSCLVPEAYIYTANYNYGFRNNNFAILHLMGDELQENLTPEIGRPGYYSCTNEYFPYFTWQKDASIDYKGSSSMQAAETWYWDKPYELIGNCNMILAEADNIKVTLEEDVARMNRVKGEALYLRASYYYMLVNLYGKPYTASTAASTPAVPLKISETIEDVEFQRSSVAEIYNQILADLTQAEAYLSKATDAPTIYHPSLCAAYILHSRIALYMQNWQEASRLARLALSEKSSLQDMRSWNTENNPISSSNPEVVFSNGASNFGNLIHPYPGKTSSWTTYSTVYSASNHLVSLFDDNDGRKVGYINKDDDKQYHEWAYHKIDYDYNRLSSIKTVSDVFSIRSVEAMLNLAEAEAQLGNDGEACKQLNTLRAKRINGAADVSLTGAELMTFIREERERELCFEGHRWFDLRRYMVDQKYPFSKTIEHTFSEYAYDSYEYDDVRTKTNYYRLEPGDDAYTLNIPRSVREFQPSIGSNQRPDREPFDVKLRDE